MHRHVLVCYDICDPKRLRQVHKIVRDFGESVQYSVFACRLTAQQRVLLEQRLLEVIAKQTDQVLLVDLGQVAPNQSAVPRSRVLGKPGLPGIADVIVL